MVDLGISEFTFGYAFLYEQTQRHWNDLRAAPILPNLQQEANQGWDAHLPLNGTDFYYQFKLSDRLTRLNATEWHDGIYNGPYYRIWLHRRDNNRQHRVLRLHADTNANTYYVAPEFETFSDFNEAFLQQRITENSRLIPLQQCDDYDQNDDGQHYITFQEGDNDFYQRSKAKRHTGSRTGKELDLIYRATRPNWVAIDAAFAQRIYFQTLAKLELVADEESRKVDRQLEAELRLLQDQSIEASRQPLLSRASRILSVVFGVTLVIVGEPPEPSA